MTLPASMPTLPVPARRPLPVQRALPLVPALEHVRALVQSVLPAMGTSLAVAAATIATEYALRALVSRAQPSLPVERNPAALRETLPTIPARVIVTEFIVQERIRRIR